MHQLRSVLRQADDLGSHEIELNEENGDDEAPQQLLHCLECAKTLNNNSLVKYVYHEGGIIRRLQLRFENKAAFYQIL